MNAHRACACTIVMCAILTCACHRPNGKAAAQERAAAADPCADARSQAEMTQCWAHEASEADRRVTDLQDQVISALGTDQPELRARFERAHRQWSAYRDDYCSAVSGLSVGGSMEPLQQAQCKARLAAAHETELKSILSDLSR